MGTVKQLYGGSIDFFRRGFGGSVAVTALTLAGLILLSFAGSMLFPQQADGIVEQFAQMLLQKGVADESGQIVFSALLMNNLIAMMTCIAYGLLPFIRLSALTLGVNGASLGLFAGYYIHKGIPLWKYLVGILPHGVFELTALVLAVSAGLYLCGEVSAGLLQKKAGAVRAAAGQCGQIMLLWILPLLLAAAAIETYLTPVLLQAVL